MLRTRTRVATVLDRLAFAIHAASRRVAGKPGGWLAALVADIFIAPVANLTGVPCTCGEDHDR